MKKSDLRALIKELLEQEIEEVSTSADAGAYNSPMAFRGNTAGGKKKNKRVATQLGMQIVKDDPAGDTISEDVSSEAKKKGLDYMYFGRWGKNGRVTHTTQGGKLVPTADDGVVYDKRIYSSEDLERIKKIEQDTKRLEAKLAKAIPDSKEHKMLKANIVINRGKISDIKARAHFKASKSKTESLSEDAKSDLEQKIAKLVQDIAYIERIIKSYEGGILPSVKHDWQMHLKKAQDKLANMQKAKVLQKEEALQENRYVKLKQSKGTPRQKIGKAISEVNKQLAEIDRVLKMNERLKTESGVNGEGLYKRTARSLVKMEAKLNHLAGRIRSMRS